MARDGRHGVPMAQDLPMAQDVTIEAVSDHVRFALAAADSLGLWQVSAYLDRALIELSGSGLALADDEQAPGE